MNQMTPPVRPSSRPPRPTSRPPSARGLPIAEGAFVPESTIEGWVRGGRATRAGLLLTGADGMRWVLQDAVRVLGRRNGDTDPYGLTGRADALREIVRRGATVSADAIRLGPAVYDFEFGSLATVCHDGAASGPKPRAPAEPCASERRG